MPLSKEQQKELEEFFLFKLWPTYPADLCGNARKKGPKGEALKKFLAIKNLDMDMAADILRDIEAQVRFDRKEKSNGQEPARWPYMTTYINQMRWKDELSDDGYERGDKKPLISVCKTEGCEEEVIGPRFDQCPACFAKEHDPWVDIRMGKMEELGLMPHPGEPKTAYYKRLREYCKDHPKFNQIGKS